MTSKHYPGGFFLIEESFQHRRPGLILFLLPLSSGDKASTHSVILIATGNVLLANGFPRRFDRRTGAPGGEGLMVWN